jgi:hypothetical protein
MKLTEWFPADAKPVRAGVYQKDFEDGCEYQYWDGSRWHYGSYTPEGTMLMFGHYLNEPLPRPWRGIKK